MSKVSCTGIGCALPGAPPTAATITLPFRPVGRGAVARRLRVPPRHLPVHAVCEPQRRPAQVDPRRRERRARLRVGVEVVVAGARCRVVRVVDRRGARAVRALVDRGPPEPPSRTSFGAVDRPDRRQERILLTRSSCRSPPASAARPTCTPAVRAVAADRRRQRRVLRPRGAHVVAARTLCPLQSARPTYRSEFPRAPPGTLAHIGRRGGSFARRCGRPAIRAVPRRQRESHVVLSQARADVESPARALPGCACVTASASTRSSRRRASGRRTRPRGHRGLESASPSRSCRNRSVSAPTALAVETACRPRPTQARELVARREDRGDGISCAATSAAKPPAIVISVDRHVVLAEVERPTHLVDPHVRGAVLRRALQRALNAAAIARPSPDPAALVERHLVPNDSVWSR